MTNRDKPTGAVACGLPSLCEVLQATGCDFAATVAAFAAWHQMPADDVRQELENVLAEFLSEGFDAGRVPGHC